MCKKIKLLLLNYLCFILLDFYNEKQSSSHANTTVMVTVISHKRDFDLQHLA